MDLKVIAKKSPEEVRNKEELMRAYIQGYKSVFGKEPSCTSCNFNSDFRRFKTNVLHLEKKGSLKNETNINTKTMSEYKVNKRSRNEIFTYYEKKKPIRRYGKDMTDEFAKEYLDNAKNKEEKEERESKFDKIPKPKKKSSVKKTSKKKSKKETKEK